MPVAKKIWTDYLMEGFYPTTSMLAASVDMSENVEYNTIYLAEAGVDPEVLKNNTTYPVPIVSRDDQEIQLVLHTFDTVNTVVRNVEAMEASYNKMESVIRGHRNALQVRCAREAAHNWAPDSANATNVVIFTTGELKNGKRRLTFADLLALETAYRNFDAPIDQANICLTPQDMEDLKLEDMKAYKALLQTNKLGIFSLHNFTKNPVFTNLGVKKAYGASIGATDSQASIAWLSSEVMRADGEVEMFDRLKDPEARGDVVGFQKRFTALKIRNKYSGAIVRATS